MGFSQTGNFSTLSAQIVATMQAIQQDGANAFAAVLPYPTVESTNGFPLCTIVPSDSPSSYLTNIQNLRSYVFFCDAYYPIEDSYGGYENAFTNMLSLVESMLDAVDNSNGFNGTSQITVPSVGSWSMTQSSVGTLLDGRITVTCKVSVSTDNG